MAGLTPFELLVLGAAVVLSVGTLYAIADGRYRLKAASYGAFCAVTGLWWLTTADGTVDGLLGFAWLGLAGWQAFRVATVEDPESTFEPWWKSE